MSLALRTSALETLRGWTAPDERQEQLRASYVDHLAVRRDGTSRDCHPAHVTVGALVLSADRSHVLLTLHAKARRWFHLGGHCEDDDTSLLAAAGREAREESGIDDLVLDPVPLHLDTHAVPFCGPHQRVDHLDVRFLATAPPGAEPLVSEESIDVRWWPVDGLPTEEAGLRAMVAEALRRSQRSSATI